MSVTRRARRATFSIGATVTVLAGLLVGASPAQAAPVVDIEALDTTVTEGGDIELRWISDDADTLTASGDWSGTKPGPDSRETLPAGAAGNYTFTLTGEDATGATSSDSVTVTVGPGITPAPVTFPDPCTVVVPATPNVTYFAPGEDGDDEPIDAGTYFGGDFASFSDPVRFYAVADAGFALTGNVPTSWDYTPAPECSGTEADLVDVVATACDEFTVTNTHTAEVEIFWADLALESDLGPENVFDLAPGASRTISTSVDPLYLEATAYAVDPAQTLFDGATVEQPAGCADVDGVGDADGSDHPTAAPAAGR